MIELFNDLCYLLIMAAILLGMIRFIKGPDALNRIIAFDTIAISVIGIVVLFSIQEKTSYYIEMILIFCLLGFASTVGFMEILFRKLFKEHLDD